jgi:hypothetical protein
MRATRLLLIGAKNMTLSKTTSSQASGSASSRTWMKTRPFAEVSACRGFSYRSSFHALIIRPKIQGESAMSNGFSSALESSGQCVGEHDAATARRLISERLQEICYLDVRETEEKQVSAQDGRWV